MKLRDLLDYTRGLYVPWWLLLIAGMLGYVLGQSVTVQQCEEVRQADVDYLYENLERTHRAAFRISEGAKRFTKSLVDLGAPEVTRPWVEYIEANADTLVMGVWGGTQ